MARSVTTRACARVAPALTMAHHQTLGMAPVDLSDGFGSITGMDSATISIGSFADEPDDLAYWLSRTPEDRLAGIELLRQQFFSYGKARPELRRLFEVTELAQR